jgi:hypothetical protein
MRGTQGSRPRSRTVLRLGLLTAILAGCATTPVGEPMVMKEGDFKILAGEWLGEAIVQQSQPAAIRGVIQDTGAFYIVPRGSSGSGQVPGVMKIVNGGVVYESQTSKGTMTFHQTDTGYVWKWNGVTSDGSTVKNELRKSK